MKKVVTTKTGQTITTNVIIKKLEEKYNVEEQ